MVNPVSSKPAKRNSSTSTAHRMLLVEDRPSDRYLIMEALERNGLMPAQFEWANSLRTAKEYLRNHQYEVILLDLNLGDSFGLDTLEDIVSESEDSAIVVVSGSLLEAPEACTAMGASAFLDKDDLSDERLREVLGSVAPETETDAGAVVAINTRDIHAASLNRIGLLDRLLTDLAQQDSAGHLLALHFSDINWNGKIDEMKKAVMVRLISKRLEALLIQTDEPAVLAHMGRAEFCIWLPCTDRFGAEKLADFLAKRAKDHALNHDLPELSSLQAGIASASDCSDASTLIVRAKQALQRASRYRVSYSVYAAPEVGATERRDQLQADIENALSAKHCRLSVRPIMNLGNKSTLAASIDVHWHLPGHAPFADEDLHQVTQNPATNQYALEILCQRASQQLKQWSGTRNRDWSIQIPLSQHVLRLQDWPTTLMQAFKDHHINPRHVWLAIKESDLVSANPVIREQLAQLSHEGYVIVVDEYRAKLPRAAEVQMFNADCLVYDARALENNRQLQNTVAENAQRFSLMIKNLNGASEREEAMRHGFRYSEGFLA